MASVRDTLTKLLANDKPEPGTPLARAVGQYPFQQGEAPLETPMFAPDDLIGMGLGKAAVTGGAKLGKEYVNALEKALKHQVETGTGIIGRNVLNPRTNILPPEKYVGKTLSGMPEIVDMGAGRLEKFGTDQRLVDIAKQHAADMGIPYTEQSAYAAVDPERAKRLAYAFELMKNEPSNPMVKKSYEALTDQTLKQYEALKKAGYNFDFMPGGKDIYGNPRNAINDIVTNKHLSVFPTESGFGGTRANQALAENPLLQPIGESWNGQPVLANDVFRAVHDVMGHAKHGVGFRAGGEENAYQAHRRLFTPEAIPALTSETRGQNSWVNFGPLGKLNKTASPGTTQYAEQKSGLLPEWAWLEGIVK
jgi:hypothetical protein